MKPVGWESRGLLVCRGHKNFGLGQSVILSASALFQNVKIPFFVFWFEARRIRLYKKASWCLHLSICKSLGFAVLDPLRFIRDLCLKHSRFNLSPPPRPKESQVLSPPKLCSHYDRAILNVRLTVARGKPSVLKIRKKPLPQLMLPPRRRVREHAKAVLEEGEQACFNIFGAPKAFHFNPLDEG